MIFFNKLNDIMFLNNKLGVEECIFILLWKFMVIILLMSSKCLINMFNYFKF